MYKQISYEQRIELVILLKQGVSKTEIATALHVSRKTIYNEINRNSSPGIYKKYSAIQAQMRSEDRRKNSNPKSKITPAMVEILKKEIGENKWSPEQVYGRKKDDGIDMVSTETIYKYIYTVDKANGGELLLSLRQAHRTRRRRKNSKDKRGTIKDRISIKERPEIVNSKGRFGDYEGDTIVGKNHKSQVGTIVERSTLYALIIPLKSKEANHVAAKINEKMKPLKDHCHTITFDNGKEFASHKKIAKYLDASIYFADPYSSWQRGCNENINGLIRQYIPKGTDLNLITEKRWMEIQDNLNNRPRKSLGYKTPNEVTLIYRSV
jgi:transposase, IS30 family